MASVKNLLRKPSRRRSSAFYLAGNLIAAAVPFLLLPILTRLIDQAEYGQVAIFQAFVTGSLAIVGLGTVGAVKRRFFATQSSDRELDYAQYVATALTILAASLAALLIFVIAFGPSFEKFIGLDTSMLALGLFVAAASFVVNLRLADYQVRDRPIQFMTYQVGLAVANFFLSLLIVVFFLRTAEGRILGMALSSLALAALSLASLYRASLIRFPYKGEMMDEALRFGVPLIPHTLGVFLLASVDRFVILTYEGLDAVGVYAAAVQLTFLLRVINDAMNKSFQPWLFEKMSDPDFSSAVIVGSIYRLAMVTFALAAMLALAGPAVSGIVLGDQYSNAGRFIPLLAIGMAFHGMYLFAINILMYERKTLSLGSTTILLGLLNLGLLFILVPQFGAMGAAIAFVIAACIRCLIVLLLCHRVRPMNWLAPRFG